MSQASSCLPVYSVDFCHSPMMDRLRRFLHCLPLSPSDKDLVARLRFPRKFQAPTASTNHSYIWVSCIIGNFYFEFPYCLLCVSDCFFVSLCARVTPHMCLINYYHRRTSFSIRCHHSDFVIIFNTIYLNTPKLFCMHILSSYPPLNF